MNQVNISKPTYLDKTLGFSWGALQCGNWSKDEYQYAKQLVEKVSDIAKKSYLDIYWINHCESIFNSVYSITYFGDIEIPQNILVEERKILYFNEQCRRMCVAIDKRNYPTDFSWKIETGNYVHSNFFVHYVVNFFKTLKYLTSLKVQPKNLVVTECINTKPIRIALALINTLRWWDLKLIVEPLITRSHDRLAISHFYKDSERINRECRTNANFDGAKMGVLMPGTHSLNVNSSMARMDQVIEFTKCSDHFKKIQKNGTKSQPGLFQNQKGADWPIWVARADHLVIEPTTYWASAVKAIYTNPDIKQRFGRKVSVVAKGIASVKDFGKGKERRENIIKLISDYQRSDIDTHYSKLLKTFYLKQNPGHSSNPNSAFIEPVRKVIDAANKRFGKLYVDNLLNSISWRDISFPSDSHHPFCKTSDKILSFLEKEIMAKVKRGEMPVSEGMARRSGNLQKFLQERLPTEGERRNVAELQKCGVPLTLVVA